LFPSCRHGFTVSHSGRSDRHLHNSPLLACLQSPKLRGLPFSSEWTSLVAPFFPSSTEVSVTEFPPLCDRVLSSDYPPSCGKSRLSLSPAKLGKPFLFSHQYGVCFCCTKPPPFLLRPNLQILLAGPDLLFFFIFFFSRSSHFFFSHFPSSDSKVSPFFFS